MESDNKIVKFIDRVFSSAFLSFPEIQSMECQYDEHSNNCFIKIIPCELLSLPKFNDFEKENTLMFYSEFEDGSISFVDENFNFVFSNPQISVNNNIVVHPDINIFSEIIDSSFPLQPKNLVLEEPMCEFEKKQDRLISPRNCSCGKSGLAIPEDIQIDDSYSLAA